MKKIKLITIFILSQSIIIFQTLIIKTEPIIPPKTPPHPEQLRGPRISSYPYISGDTFRVLCNFVIDEIRIPFNPKDVKDGDLIFLKSELLDFFFNSVYSQIKSKYILVSHNTDFSIPGNYARYLEEDNIIAWFGQNTDITFHPKLHPLPIGIANRYWPWGNIEILNRLISQLPSISKNKLLYLNCDVRTNQKERSDLYNLFADKSFCYYSNRKPWMNYLQDMAQSMFILSPKGNGLDCHRTWEALLMGCIPIVKSSTLNRLYKNLPVIIINDWNEITEEFLIKKYKELGAIKFNLDKIYAQYWINQIKDCQSKFIRTNSIKKQFIKPECFGIDFNTSMRFDEAKIAIAQNNPYMALAKSLYDKYIVTDLKYSETPRIPKIIHQVWVGGKPFPEQYRRFQENWIKQHPDWEYKLWTDKEVEKLGLINKNAYKIARNVGEKSDILRYELLYRFGGLYVDTDFECLRPFDTFNHCCDFYTGLEYTANPFNVFCGLIGSRAGHPILKEAVEQIEHSMSQSQDNLSSTGPYFFTRCIKKYLPEAKDRIVLFPIGYFYPWPAWERHNTKREDIEKWFSKESYAVHHWHVTWSK